MGSDLVDRLRAHALDEGTDSRLLDEAANEIRRLRSALREIAANAASEPYSGEYALDALNGRIR